MLRPIYRTTQSEKEQKSARRESQAHSVSLGLATEHAVQPPPPASSGLRTRARRAPMRRSGLSSSVLPHPYLGLPFERVKPISDQNMESPKLAPRIQPAEVLDLCGYPRQPPPRQKKHSRTEVESSVRRQLWVPSRDLRSGTPYVRMSGWWIAHGGSRPDGNGVIPGGRVR